MASFSFFSQATDVGGSNELSPSDENIVATGRVSQTVVETTQKVISDLRADSKAQLAALKGANPAEREAIFQSLRDKQQAAAARLKQLRASLPTPPKPSAADVEERIAKTAPPELKEALIERHRLVVAREAVEDQTKALASDQREEALREWQASNAGQTEAVQGKVEQALATIEAKKPERAEDSPAQTQARIALRDQMTGEFAQLKEQIKNASPEEQSAAVKQWIEANRAKARAINPNRALSTANTGSDK